VADVRLLHTSDWHLGRSFHRVGLLDAQARVLDHLVDVVASERVDAVVVAGDVYDRALPAVDAVELLDEALDRLVGTGATVLLTSGNHDSAQRLAFGARRSARAGVHVRARPASAADPVVLEDRHGPVALYGVPYLEPALVAEPLGVGRTHEAVLSAAMGAVRADLGRRPGGTRSVVAAHAFVTGGAASDSERDISVGGVAAVPAAVFDGVDYVALGHLHGRQRLGSRGRYSGSPLAYSFSEHRQTKGSWLVELGRDGVERVDPVDAPVPRRLAVLRGTLDDLLGDPRHGAAQGAWCQVTLTDARRPVDAMERLRRRFPHTLSLSFDPAGTRRERASYADRAAGLGDLELCCAFLDHVRGREADDDERRVLRAALESERLPASALGSPVPTAREGTAREGAA
jgi:DNA repair protein SbcD/Mre11